MLPSIWMRNIYQLHVQFQHNQFFKNHGSRKGGEQEVNKIKKIGKFNFSYSILEVRKTVSPSDSKIMR